MRVLRTILVTPSRYDELGVLVYRISFVQNGSLTALAGLIEDYNRRHAGIAEVRYEIFNEFVREAIRPELLRTWRDDAARNGEHFVLMVCGVQTTMYPRARDIALMARREGIDVIVGGVHLSGHGPSAEFLAANGVSVAIGEVEPIWDRIIDDALDGDLAPVYRIGADEGLRIKAAVSNITASDLTDIPFPHLPMQRGLGFLSRAHIFIDASRGCPFMCSFCAVKNMFGRTVRSRDPKALVAWMGERAREGTRVFSYTDDNFARNPRHLEILEGIAQLRANGADIGLVMMLDVEATCYAGEDSERGKRTRHFLGLCRAAGVMTTYLGLESTNDAALKEMHKSVNRDRGVVHGTPNPDSERAASEARRAIVERYRAAVSAWQSIGATVDCGYMLGFDADGPGEGRQAARDLREIGIDSVAFVALTPIPGAEDYARAVSTGTLAEHDFNEFFSSRPVITHPTMSRKEVAAEIKIAMRSFYSPRNVATHMVRRLLGISRPRVKRAFVMSFLRRQVLLLLIALQGKYSSFWEAGLLRRKKGLVRRQAITDAEAKAYFLGPDAVERPTGLPASVLDDASMHSLPILNENQIGTPDRERSTTRAPFPLTAVA